jgi:hypothetical protein
LKPYLFILLCLLSTRITTAQSEKIIRGKVSYQNTYQKDIDVVNFNNKYATLTNYAGKFTVLAKAGDVLIFMSDSFIDQKYKLTPEDIEKGEVSITLSENPIPLDEVEIAKVKSFKTVKVSYNDRKMAKIQKDSERPKNDVYTGEIVNGIDFIQVGKMIGKLFKSNKLKTSQPEQMGFKDYAKANFNDSFFSNTLKIAPVDLALFLDYCESDPKSKDAVASNDELTLLEFLNAKKVEFEKLK